MTIASTLDFLQIPCNGATTQFSFNNKIFLAADLIVTLLDPFGNLYAFVPTGFNTFTNPATGLSYTVFNVDVDSGCFIAFTAAPTSGWTLDLRTSIAELQSTSIKNQGSFLPELHEEFFDKATRMLQDLLRRTYTFGIHGPDIENTPWPALPSAAIRKGMQIIFDPITGVPTVGVPNTQVITQGLLAPFLNLQQTPAESANGIVPSNLGYVPGNILRYGADPTGVASSWTALKNAVTVCKATGAVVIVPAGNFLIDTVNGTINLSYVTIWGTGVTDGSATPTAAGSVLSITGAVNSPFTMGPGVTFDGVGFFYPAQVDSFTPIPFPPTIVTSLAIAGAINFCYVQNCTVFNAYRFFVDTDATGAIGHVFFIDNTIYGILTCFESAYNAEIITFSGNEFTFGHYLAASEAGLRKFTRANGNVLQVARTDGLTFVGNVIYGYATGVGLFTTGGLCQLTSITDNYFDNVLQPIVASGSGNITSFTIGGNVFSAFNSQLTTSIGTSIQIITTGVAVSEQITISGNQFGTCTGNQVSTAGATQRFLAITGNTFTSWAAFQASGNYGALSINGAATSFLASGNMFLSQASPATVATGINGSCVDAAITGNVFGQCQFAINCQFNAVVVSGNISFGTNGTFANNYLASGSVLDVGNTWDKNGVKTPNLSPIASYGNFANDAAAAAGGVFVGGQYRNGSVVQVRVV